MGYTTHDDGARSLARARRLAVSITSILILSACASTASDMSEAAFVPEGKGSGSASSDNAGAAADDDATSPEREVESNYESPIATSRAVWVANPKSGRVAVIDAVTLGVKTVDAGNGPTYLAAVPGAEDAAIVLNVLSDDATLLRVNGASIETKTFKTAHGLNSWSLSADGHWAIAWTDARKVTNAKKTQGFQDLTVIDLTGAHAPQVLAVGYRPLRVGFAGTTEAYAVTQDGISIVDLTGATPELTKNVAISDDPLEDPGTRDVSVTQDGSLALIRRDNNADVTFVSLATGTRSKLTLSGPVSDLDLSPNGDKAVAVVKKTGIASVLPIPQIVSDPLAAKSVTLTGETVGSVAISQSGSKAVLYSNASEVERISVVSLSAAPTFRTIRLYAPVLAVFSTKSAEHAVAFHDTTDEAAPAFSLIPIEETLPAKIVSANAPLAGIAFAEASDRAVITERSSSVYGAYLAHLPSMMVERYPLASPPSSVGIVDVARRAFISQEYPEGRITFIDLDTGLARTLTGFELSARVVEGSKP